MFDLFDTFTKPITTALDVAESSFDYMLGEGDGPSKKQVAELISAGLSVAVVAQGFDVAENVIEKLMED